MLIMKHLPTATIVIFLSSAVERMPGENSFSPFKILKTGSFWKIKIDFLMHHSNDLEMRPSQQAVVVEREGPTEGVREDFVSYSDSPVSYK